MSFGWIARFQSVLVVIIIAFMAVKMGGNDEVIKNLKETGVRAIAISLVSLFTTVLSLCCVRKALGYNKFAERKINSKIVTCENVEKQQQDYSNIGLTATTKAIIIFMIIGFIAGYIIFARIMPEKYIIMSKISGAIVTGGLYLLVGTVSFDLGLDKTFLKRFENDGPIILVFPFVSAVSTVVTMLIFSCIFDLTFKEAMAIACTFCWYSLGPNIIMEAGMIYIGALSFATNFFRVIFSIILIPFVSKKVGYIETTGMPLAASMDVCISVIEKSTNKQTTVYAFVSGLIFTALVPLIVPLIVS